MAGSTLRKVMMAVLIVGGLVLVLSLVTLKAGGLLEASAGEDRKEVESSLAVTDMNVYADGNDDDDVVEANGRAADEVGNAEQTKKEEGENRRKGGKETSGDAVKHANEGRGVADGDEPPTDVDKDGHYLARVDETEEARRKRIVTGEQGIQENTPEFRSFIFHSIVDEERKLIFAWVPKVGCTEWKIVFYKWAHGGKIPPNVEKVADSIHYIGGLHPLGKYSKEEQMRMIHPDSEYRIAVFVRNPFSRLLSAYTDKMVRYIKERGIIMNFIKQLHIPLDATFAQFVDIVTSVKQPHTLDEHLRPQSTLIAAGQIKFDFVGFFENMGPDADAMFAELGIDAALPTRAPRLRTHSGSADRLKESFTPELMKKVVDYYKEDFERFLYPSDHLPGAA